MIRKRGERTYQIRVYIGTKPDGTPDTIYETFHGSFRAAQDREAEIKMQAGRGQIVNSNITLEKLIEMWLEHVRKNREVRTADDYEYCAGYINAAMGSTQVRKLKPLQVQRFFDDISVQPRSDKRQDTLSVTTIRHFHRALHAALSFGMRMRLIDHNPAQYVELPKPQKSKPPLISENQMNTLLAEATTKRPDWHVMWALCSRTGLRVGELCGLWWDDIDWQKSRIDLRRQLKRRKGKPPFIGGLKSHEERSVLFLDHSDLDMLERHKFAQEQAQKRGGDWQHPEHVFVRPRGKWVYPTVPTQVLGKFSEDLKLPHLKIHALRHYHGSWLLQHGWDLAAVSKRLGHHSVAFTASVYIHDLPGAQEKYIAAARDR